VSRKRRSTSVTGGTGSFTTLTASNVTTLAAGTTSIAPLKFQSGTNLTTAQAGAAEYDGTVFYLSPQASNRAAINARHFVVLSSNNTLTNNTSAQPMFDGGGGSANGRITLNAGTYRFSVTGLMSGLSGSSHSLTFTFGGTATIGSVAGIYATDTALSTTAAFTSNSITLQTGSTVTAVNYQINGVLRLSVGGTLIPQLTQGTNSAAANVLTNSNFEISPLGSSSVATVGAWD